jgi:transcriptional regulator with PAS, ATPase and Fis domain
MIKILFCLPYAQMKTQIIDILCAYTAEDIIEPSFLYSNNSNEFAASAWEVDCDAIVARGMTAAVLRSKVDMDIPVVELQVSGSDIVRTIQKCREIHHCHKIAVVGPASMSYAAKVMSSLSDFPIEVCYLRDYREVGVVVTECLRSGCDAIIGGTTAYTYAASIGARAVLIENSEESLWNAIEEALHSIRLQRREREQGEFLKIVVKNYKEGIVAVDANRNIKIINEYAAQAIGVRESDCRGKNAMIWFHDLGPAITAAFSGRGTVTTELFVCNGRSYSTTIIPIIIREQATSAILCFESIRSIQKREQQIRNMLHGQEMAAGYTFGDSIHRSREMEELINKAKRFALVESSILISGETGVGKELFAQSIHNYSHRRNAPFVAINCAALPESLLESELFGYSSGAFTGAAKDGKQGLFELAHNGTLFLDEISEMPLQLQGKLLRVLQEKEIRRIGEGKVVPVNIRVLAATNKNLYELMRQNQFRPDLYYRLAVLELNILPLREHPDDIIPLFEAFVSRLQPHAQKRPVIAKDALALLLAYPWEGNIRELQNIAERVSVLNDKPVIEACDIRSLLPGPNGMRSLGKTASPVNEEEVGCIMEALEHAASRKEAAGHLGMSRSTLWRKSKKYGIT